MVQQTALHPDPQMDRYLRSILHQAQISVDDKDAMESLVAEMATPGYNWDMFSAAGNAACSHALAGILEQLDGPDAREVLTHLASTFGAAVLTVIDAGHREVSDTEPETAFAVAANLIAMARDADPVTRWEIAETYNARLDEDTQVASAAREAATRRLIEAHPVEFAALEAEELTLRRS